MKDKNFRLPRELVTPPMLDVITKMNDDRQKLVQSFIYPNNDYLTMVSSFQKTIQQSIKTINPILEAVQRLNNFVSTIDWDKVSEDAKQHLKDIDALLKEHEKGFWCLDYSLANKVIDDAELDAETDIAGHIESSLDEYLEHYSTEPIYTMHMSLLSEAVNAYKDGYFKLCLAPLFSVVDYLITSWFAGNLKKIGSRSHQKNLYYRVKKLTRDEQNELDKVFAQSILRIYEKTFKSDSSVRFCTKLNRHSVAHGYHDYNSVKKEDALKIFQLLKSMSLLTSIDPEDLKEVS